MRHLGLFLGAFMSVMACTPSAPSATATTAAPPTTSPWSYRIQGAVASDFVETHMPTSPIGFLVRMASPDVSVDSEWRCGADGLTALQASRLSTAQTQLRFVSTSVTG